MEKWQLITAGIMLWYLIGIYTMKAAQRLLEDEDTIKPHEQVGHQEIFVLGLLGPIIIAIALITFATIGVHDLYNRIIRKQ